MGRPKKQNREPFWRCAGAGITSRTAPGRSASPPTRTRRGGYGTNSWPGHPSSESPPPAARRASPWHPRRLPRLVQKHKAGDLRLVSRLPRILRPHAAIRPDHDQLKPFHVQQWIDGKPTWKTGKRGRSSLSSEPSTGPSAWD